MIIAINGEIIPKKHAKVSVLDRGFLFGDAIYEVTRSYGNVLFQLEKHIDRLYRSAESIGLNIGLSSEELMKEIYRIHDEHTGENLYVRIQISRGEGEIGLDPDLSTTTNRVIYVQPFKALDESFYKNGVKVAVVPRLRNSRYGMSPNIKSGNYLNNILALQDGKKYEAYEVFMVNSEGFLTEGTTSNLFFIKNGNLVTTPDDWDILKGITRSIVIKEAKKAGIPVECKPFKLEELMEADEVFLTSSTRELMPICSINGTSVGKQKRDVFSKLVSFYKSVIKDYCDKHIRN